MRLSPRQLRIQKILEITSQEIAQLGIAERRPLLDALRVAEVELAAGLKGWLNRVADPTARFTPAQMAGVFANVRDAISQIEKLNGPARDSLSRARRSSFNMARAHVSYQFEHFSQIFDGEFRPINIRVASNVLQGDRLLIRKHASSAARYSETAKEHIQRQIGVGIIKGESIEQMTSRLMGLGPTLDAAKEVTSEGMASGLLSLPRAQANRLVRTEVISAYNQYHIETMKDLSAQINEPVFKRWDSSLDARGCDECRGLDGEIQPEGEKFSNGIEMPPAHPNCRCTVVPWMESWGKMEGQDKGTGSIDAPKEEPGL